MPRTRALTREPKNPGRQRKAVHGATRKTAPVEKKPRSFIWVNRVLIFLGVGVVLGALVKAAVVLHAIPVERIAVTGKLEHTRNLAIQEMVQPVLEGGFLSADLQRIREQLESLPWVYEATVKRVWPNALEINVLEQLPIARWGDSGFLNHAGEIFESANASSVDALPRLSGPDGAERTLIGRYQLVTDYLAPVGLEVEGLTVDGRGQMRAALSGGIEIEFGDGALIARLERFVTLYRTGLDQRRAEIVRVDMRYESGVAVAFRVAEEVAGL